MDEKSLSEQAVNDFNKWPEKRRKLYQEKKAEWWKQQSQPKFPFNYCPHCGGKLHYDIFTKEIHDTTK